MTFLSRHTLTAPAADAVSGITELLNGVFVIDAGMYDGGLIAILDRSASKDLLRSWPQYATRCRALFTTAFGEVFAFDEARQQIFFLNTQYGTTTFIDPEVAWVLNDFLEDPGVKADLLQTGKVERLRRRSRELRYHEAFILEPWLMFGGEDVDECYVIGSCATYVDLVGQTIASA